MRVSATLLLVSCLAVGAVNAGSAAPEFTRVGPYLVHVSLDPHGAGACPMSVDVALRKYDATGHLQQLAASGLEVDVQPRMPTMPGIRVPTTHLAASRAGHYEGRVDFAMGGTWEVETRLQGPAGVGSCTTRLQIGETTPAETTPGGAGSPPTAPPTAMASPSGSVVVSLGEVSPGTVGQNVVSVRVADGQGHPLDNVSLVCGLTMPGMAMSMVPRPANPDSPGLFTLSTRLGMAGEWRLTVDVDRGDQRLYQQSFPVIVRNIASLGPSRWPTVVLAFLTGLGLVELLRRRTPGAALPVAILVLALVLGELLHHLWPADTTTGMPMDMSASDMGWSAAELKSPLPVEVATLARQNLVVAATEYATVCPSQGHRLDPVLLKADIPVDDAVGVAVGTPVTLGLPTDSHQRPLTTVLRRVDRRVDPSTQSVHIEALLQNPDLRVHEGQTVPIRLEIIHVDNVLVLPYPALTSFDGHPAVWRVDDVAGQLIAHLRQVDTGEESDQGVEVVSGLDVGNRVVVSDLGTLEEGMLVSLGVPASGPYHHLLMPQP